MVTPVTPYPVDQGREMIDGIPPNESWAVHPGKLGLEVPLQFKANIIEWYPGEIFECIFGMIYGNKVNRSLVTIICGVFSANMLIIINLIIVMEDQLYFNCTFNEE